VSFFSDIVRDSQRPPPDGKSAAHGAGRHSGGDVSAMLPADSRPLGLEAAAPLTASKSHKALKSTVAEQGTRHKGDAPSDIPPIEPSARQAVGPGSVEYTRATGFAQFNHSDSTPPSPATRKQGGRPGRRAVTAQPSSDQASTSNEVVSTAADSIESEDALFEAVLAQRQASGVRKMSGEMPESRPGEKIARAETAVPLNPPVQNLRMPSAFPPPTLSTPTEDVGGSGNAKPASDANQDVLSLPAEAKPHPSDLQEMPPAAAIPVSLAQEQSDTLPESGDDISPTPDFRVVAAHPAAPIQIESLAARSPFQDQGESGADWAPSQAVQTPDAVPEGPKVHIGLLEVTVMAPENAAKGMHRADKTPANIASRHYLRNL